MNPVIQHLLNHRALICSHRGFHGGNIVENSAEAIQLAFRAGAEIVEVDIAQSKDKDYFLFHDGAEVQLYGQDTPFHELTTEFIQSTPLKNSLGLASSTPALSLAEAIENLPPALVLNIDRSWPYWENGFLEELAKLGKTEQLLLKSPPATEYLEAIAESPFYYMPILDDPSDFAHCKEIVGEKLIGVELVIEKEEDLDTDFIHELHKQGLFLFVNAINLDSKTKLFGPWDDEISLKEGADAGWGQLMEIGADVIQTDWPSFLNDYRMDEEFDIWDAVDLYSDESNWQYAGPGIQAIVVYGYALQEDGKISPVLEQRLKKALELAEVYAQSKVIVSGGLPVNGKTEATAMKEYLVENGLAEERIIEEGNSFDTVTNNQGILKILQDNKLDQVLLISSKIHLPRCILGLQEMAQANEYPIEIRVGHPDDADIVRSPEETELYEQALQIEELLDFRNVLWSRGDSDLRILV